MAFGLFAAALLSSGRPLSVPYDADVSYYYFHSFSSGAGNWTQSAAAGGKWVIDGPSGMVFTQGTNAHYGLSTAFPAPFVVGGRDLVVQFEVQMTRVPECGGAYIKLFPGRRFVPRELTNRTAYSVMFGPDKCGVGNRTHFIYCNSSEESHMSHPPAARLDTLRHLYTLIIRPDDTFEILIDTETVRVGSFPTAFDGRGPPVFGSIAGVGFEFWSTHGGVGFDNIFVGRSEHGVRSWNAHWRSATAGARPAARVSAARPFQTREALAEFAAAIWKSVSGYFTVDPKCACAFVLLLCAIPEIMKIVARAHQPSDEAA
jgi:hypothetical protein